MSKKKECTTEYNTVILLRDSDGNIFLKSEEKGKEKMDLSNYVDIYMLRQAIEDVEKKYVPDGLCFELAKRLLKKYRFYSCVEKKNSSEVKNIQREIFEKNILDDFSYHIKDEEDEQLCINDILHRRSSSKRMLNYYAKLDNLGLSSEGVRLVKKAYKCLLNSKDKDLEKEAELIYKKYLASKVLSDEELYKELGLTKATFYRLESRAISDMAFSMFDGIVELTEDNPEWKEYFNSLLGLKEKK